MITEQIELHAPVGLAGIVREFGDIGGYVGADGCLDSRWEIESLGRVNLPFGMLLSWDHTRTVNWFRCHRRLTPRFGEGFPLGAAAGLPTAVSNFSFLFISTPPPTTSKLS